VTTNLRIAINSERLYDYGFSKYDVGVALGLNNDDLKDLSDQLITYFNSEEEYIHTDLFDERETEHMRDVKGLVRLNGTLQIASWSYVGIFIVVGLLFRKRSVLNYLPRLLLWGGWLTVALILVIGLWSVVDFDSLFLAFHLLSFNNDLWLLYPGDSLLILFPQGFFNEAALFVAGFTIVEAILMGAVAWFWIRKSGCEKRT
jgi:integral membrane protein (TIGR01906 family)